MHHHECFYFVWDNDRETVTLIITVYWVQFCLYMELSVAPLVAGTDNNTNPGANFTNKLKFSQLSLYISFEPKNRHKYLREICPIAFKGGNCIYPYGNLWAPKINLRLILLYGGPQIGTFMWHTRNK